MHETIIARKIISEAEKKAGKGRKISSIILEVGELGPIHDHELQEILATLTKWEVKIKSVKAIAKCSCGYKGRPKIIERGHEFCVYLCPKCKKVPKLTAGDKIIIKGISVQKVKA